MLYQTRKWTWFVSLALSIMLVVAGGLAQYWLPRLIADKAEVEQYLSKLSKQKITVGQIHASWDGIYPGVRLLEIEIQDPDAKQGSLSLKEMRLSLSYFSAIRRAPVLHRLVLVEPELEVSRHASGKIIVSGIRTKTQPIGKPDRQSPGNGAVVKWLLAQGKIEIQNGSVIWRDYKDGRHSSVNLQQVDLVLENSGDRHQVSFSARFPDDICSQCTFTFDIEGNPLVSSDWGGFLNVNAIGLKVRNRLTELSKRIPDGLDGTVDLVLRSQWAQGQPRLAYGRVTASDLDVPLGKFGQSLTVNQLVSTLKWRSRKNNWSLEMDLPFVRINNESWLPGQLKVSRYVGGTGLYLRHLDIKRALTISEHFNIPEKARKFLVRLQPEGYIDDLEVNLKDEAGEEDRLRIKATLRNIKSLPYKKIPGFSGLSADVNTTESGGEIFLDSRRSVFNSTHVFRKPIPVHRAKARLTWQYRNSILEVITQNFQIVGRDLSARGGFVFRFPWDRSQSPQLNLRAELFNGSVAKKSIYLPVNVLKPGLVKWLDDSIISGKVTTGHVVYQGKVREFPFINNNGLFEVEANVERGELKFLPQWQPITGANMKLLFRGRSMVISGSAGKVGQLDLNEIVARKDDLKSRIESVKITGRASGSVASAIAVLRNAAANGQKGGWTRFVESNLQVSGNGQLSLRAEIPPTKDRSHRLYGRYEFIGSGMVLPAGDIPITGMRGGIRFDARQVLDGRIDAAALGGAVGIDVKGPRKPEDPDLLFDLDGRITARALSREYGQWIGKNFSGVIPWSGQVSFRNGVPTVSLRGRMNEFRTSLPQPVQQVSASSEPFLVESATEELKRHILRLSLGDKMSGLLDFQSRASGWNFSEGRILVGEGQARLRGNQGLHLEFNGTRASGEQWVEVIHDQGSGSEPIPYLIKSVSGRFLNVDALGRDWGQAEFRVLRKTLSQWSGDLAGDNINGKVLIDTAPRGGSIGLNLDKFYVPGSRKEETQENRDKGQEYDPRIFPTLDIVSKDFRYGDMNLGRLDFSADHTRIGWEIDRLQLTRPEMSLFANGTWFRIAGNHVTKAKIRLTSSDLGESLAAVGSAGQVTGGTLNMDLNVNWRQDRDKMGLENLNGDLSLHARNGKFNKIEPGGNGSNGALSLFALSRYLSLDFSPIFGKGLAFDEIKGKINIQQGDAKTDGFTMSAPVAAVVASGHVDLNRKVIDLNADIYPNLKGGVTVATGTLFGLQAAAWAFAVQQLFSSEIKKETKISYHVTGKLDDPKVTKVVSKAEKK